MECVAGGFRFYSSFAQPRPLPPPVVCIVHTWVHTWVHSWCKMLQCWENPVRIRSVNIAKFQHGLGVQLNATTYSYRCLDKKRDHTWVSFYFFIAYLLARMYPWKRIAACQKGGFSWTENVELPAKTGVQRNWKSYSCLSKGGFSWAPLLSPNYPP